MLYFRLLKGKKHLNMKLKKKFNEEKLLYHYREEKMLQKKNLYLLKRNMAPQGWLFCEL